MDAFFREHGRGEHMKSAKLIICVACAMFAAINPARTQALVAGHAALVRVQNFICAESDLYITAIGLGRDSVPADWPWR